MCMIFFLNRCPAVVGITTLALDHTAILGDTIKDIAWHKAGICKVRFNLTIHSGDINIIKLCSELDLAVS